MEINKKEIHRIVVTFEGDPSLNLVYAEVGEDYEIFGAFSGICGGLGMFHQNSDGEITVSDDPFEFDTKFVDEVEEISSKMESLRAEFEETDDDGNLIGLSDQGKKFVKDFPENDGEVFAHSEDASDDFIIDIQDDWNLAYNM